jgi:fatty-acyl-CoA synthase
MPMKPVNLCDLFATVAEAGPDRIALTGILTANPKAPASRWTRRQLADDIGCVAYLLPRVTQRPKPRLGILLPTVPEMHLLLWGGMSAGSVALINPLLNYDHAIALLDAMAVDCLAIPTPSLDPVLAELGGRLSQQRPDISIITIGSGGSFETGMVFERAQCHTARRLDRDPSEIAAVFHTGGTTGVPKIAPLSFANVIAASDALATTLAFGSNDVFVCPLPLFHIAGAIVGGLAPLLAGTHMVIPPKGGLRDPDVLANFWALLEHVEATMLVAVPTSLAALTTIPIGGANISRLNYVLTGTAPLPAEIARRFEALTGKSIHTGYGMTETSGIIAYVPRKVKARPSTVGPPVPGIEVKIDVLAPAESSSDKPRAGRILVRGPSVFLGYQGSESRSANAWFDTGDLGQIDNEGYLSLTGRSKDLIIRGGHNIDPAMIEEAAARHPSVAIAAAVGQIDNYAGEIPILYIQLNPGWDGELALREIAALLKQLISEPPARPREIVEVTPMPLTAVGKIFKPALRLDAAKRRIQALLKQNSFGDVSFVLRTGDGGEIIVTLQTIGANQFPEARLRQMLGLFPVTIEIESSV